MYHAGISFFGVIFAISCIQKNERVVFVSIIEPMNKEYHSGEETMNGVVYKRIQFRPSAFAWYKALSEN